MITPLVSFFKIIFRINQQEAVPREICVSPSIERRTTGIPAIVVGEKRFAYKHVGQGVRDKRKRRRKRRLAVREKTLKT